MHPLKITFGAKPSSLLFCTSVPVIVTGFLWATTLYDVTLPQVLAAFILCWIPSAAYEEWRRGTRESIPLFFLVSSVFWVSYAMPLFWLKHDISLVSGLHQLSEDSITRSLFLVVLGVAALGVGMRVAERWRFTKVWKPDIHRSPARWSYLRFALLAATCLRLLVPISALGGGVRQFLAIVETVVPSVAFVILLRYYLRGIAIPFDKVLLAGYAGVALITGIASGWMGSFVGLAIMATGVYIYERRKFPLMAIVISVPIILFLQPGKDKFRQQYWRAGASEGYAERFNFWIDSSWTEWARALSSSDPEQIQSLANRTLGRLSLLEQTANVMESTPEIVPYQNARLYSYMLVTFIPRAFWPDKPSVNDSNRWYQVAYRLTLVNGLNGVSIAVGYLPESYISFGWLGSPIIMFCMGLLLAMFDKGFLRMGSGLLLNSIGLVLLPQLLQVESQLAQYIAGIGQQILVALIVMAPMFELHRRKRHQGQRDFHKTGPNHTQGYAALSGHPSPTQLLRR